MSKGKRSRYGINWNKICTECWFLHLKKKQKTLTLSEGCSGKFTCIFFVRVRISRCVAIERGREKKREKGRVRKKREGQRERE